MKSCGIQQKAKLDFFKKEFNMYLKSKTSVLFEVCVVVPNGRGLSLL